MTPDPVDEHIGARLVQRRNELGLSQAAGARLLEVSNSQIRKYEAGTNRISVERLYQIAALLNVEVGYFYSGLPFVVYHDSKILGDWLALQTAASIEAIEDGAVRKSFLELISVIETKQT